RITHQRGALLVQTKAAKVTDVVSQGRVTFSGTPDMRSAVLQKTVAPAGGKAAADLVPADFAPAAYPYVGSPPGMRLARAAAAPTL
ncbi:hypothetical protein ABTK63_20705, partial [Acinetobacter baumannii]